MNDRFAITEINNILRLLQIVVLICSDNIHNVFVLANKSSLGEPKRGSFQSCVCLIRGFMGK